MMSSKKIPIDLIFFDFDGTLADSIPPAISAIQQMLKDLNYPHKTKEEIQSHVGYGEIPLVAGAIGINDSRKVDEAMKIYFKYYMDSFANIPLYPHVEDILKKFKDKIKVIISNKNGKLLRMILEAHGISNYFVEVLGGEESPCLKPDPCAINEFLKKYNIPPERAMIVGDMTVDIETGKNAKIWTCAVAYGFESKEKLSKSKPDFLIEDILELTNFIQNAK